MGKLFDQIQKQTGIHKAEFDKIKREVDIKKTEYNKIQDKIPVAKKAFDIVAEQDIIDVNAIADKLNVIDIYENSFGFKSAPLDLDSALITNLKDKANNFTSFGTKLYTAVKNGFVFCPVTLIVNTKEYILPFSTINVQSQKRIIETHLAARKGSVKELVNIQDYNFTIKGIAIDHTKEIPEGDINNLKFLYETTHPIQLKNAITDFFLDKDDYVVIKSLKLPDMKGVSHAQAYEFSVVGDSNLILTVE